MDQRQGPCSSRLLPLVLIAVFLAASPQGVLLAEEGVVDKSTFEEALRLGERMYREGLLSSGEPMKAVVQGDIPVDGSMFSCMSCHLRSGVGSIEGTVITLPTNAGWLFEPFVGARMTQEARDRLPEHLRRSAFRPAYTRETLARALRVGTDPTGRKLNGVMPRYLLNEEEMSIMLDYLENLSAELSPGVTETTLYLATVITDDVPTEMRDAMLLPLQAHVEAVNSQSRHQERRSEAGPFYKEEKFTAYRRLELSVWELEGPQETWQSQLEAAYQKQPVFALVGGISMGDWRPIHEFCEAAQIPSLFPVTDFPVISDTDWYTLYLSKGWYQQGETVARYLRAADDVGPEDTVVQIYRDDRVGRVLASALRETSQALDWLQVEDRRLEPDVTPSAAFWRGLASEYPEAVFVLWLESADLAGIEALASAGGRPRYVFLSAPLLGEAIGSVPQEVRSFTYLTHPYSLPGEKPRAELATRQWLRSKRLPLTHERIQSEMYFLSGMLAGSVKHMRHDFYRDYLLDVMDMMRDQYYSVATYSRLSFGPGQRYASKGCYIVQLGDGPQPELIARTGWVVH